MDWTVCAYIRDSAQLGHPRVMYNPGHFNFEELGMKYFAKCLAGLVGDIQVRYVPSRDAFGFVQ